MAAAASEEKEQAANTSSSRPTMQPHPKLVPWEQYKKKAVRY